MGYRDQISIVTFFNGEEKRDAGRVRVVMRGTLRWPGGRSPVPCTIRNISGTGAKIALPTGIVPPDEFELVVAELGVCVRAGAMWRRRGYMGVSFLGAPLPEEGSGEAVAAPAA